MLLKIIENGNFRDIHIREGETFLVPGMVQPIPNAQPAPFNKWSQETPLTLQSDRETLSGSSWNEPARQAASTVCDGTAPI